MTSTRCSSIASRRVSLEQTHRASARPTWPAIRWVSRTCGVTAYPGTCRSCSSASPSAESLPLARHLLNAQEYWRVKGLRADVVLLNEHPADYVDEMQNFLSLLVQQPPWAGRLGKPGGIFLLRSDGMPEPDRRLLSAVARVVLLGELGDLVSQLERPAPWLFAGHDVPRSAALQAPEPAPTPATVPPLVMANGLGGFTRDGREYVVVLDGERETPLPWSNVLANPTFGTIVSSSGSAFTWSGNSRENRLTPFANDPLTDPTGEALYLRDDDTGAVWGATPGPLPRRADGGRWIVRHAAGVTRYQHAVAGMEQALAVFVAPEDHVKLAVLTLTNTADVRRRLSVFGYVEWCLGPPRAGERRFVVTEMDDEAGVLLARNAYNAESRDRVAFWRTTATPRSHTGDRAEFIGRNRTLSAPAALFRERLAGRTGAGLDPCGALQIVARDGARRIPKRGLRPRPGARPGRRDAAGGALFLRRAGGGDACGGRVARGTRSSAPSRSARRTIRSISSSIAGCSTRR